MTSGPVVIVGGGLAGLRTAEELRARGYQGALTMLAAEDRPPYDRPPLSKAALLGEPDAAELGAELDTTLKADFGALGADLRLGEPATGLELANPGAAGASGGPGGLVRTARAAYPFGTLVVATGAAAVALPGRGRQRFLRTHTDALELRRLLRPGLRLVIVGAG